MKPLEFKIIKNCFKNASHLPGNDADFYLEEDSWNDHDFYVLYHLHATKRITKSENVLVGDLRIMRHGQQRLERNLLSSIFQKAVFNELPQDFVSLSLDYDLYKWLSFRPVEERLALAAKLHLILSREGIYYDLVKNDDCFNEALLRDSTMDNYVLHKANSWIYHIERRYDIRKQQITLKYDNCDEYVQLSFSCLPSVESDDIPNGIVAFIGANGAGKSTALYSLAKAMYLYPETRDIMERQFCRIIPNDIGVERMILISYSPFDNFTIPSTENFALKDMGGEQDDRFIYCGIRDLNEEYKSHGECTYKDLEYIQQDREEITVSKDQKILAAEFAVTFEKIKNGRYNNRFYMWEEILEMAMDEHSDLAEIMKKISDKNNVEDWIKEYMSLSTGYKFFFHSIVHVIAFILEGSLILFDEPENHVQPSLLSFVMKQYRRILSRHKSVMLVSTHSPVIVQELFADNVLKVYREGSKIRIKKPEIETYGATFGEINSEVFGLTTDVSRYFTAFDKLYQDWNLGSKATVQEMLETLKQNLRRSASNQVISYLISKYYGDNPDRE